MKIERNDFRGDFSPEKSAKYLEWNTWPGQAERYRPEHMHELGQKMKDGRFHLGRIFYVITRLGTFLIDGQHQLTASVTYKQTFRAAGIKFVIEGGTEAQIRQKVAELYSQHNVDMRRSRGDIAFAKAVGMGWQSWPKQFLQHLAAALELANDESVLNSMETRSCKKSLDQTGDLFIKYPNECLWAADILLKPEVDKGGKRRMQPDVRHMLRVPVLAAMIQSYRKCQRDATAFWTAVRDMGFLANQPADKDVPTFVLRNFLRKSSIYGDAKNAQQKEQTTRKAVYAKCVHAWNAFRGGYTTALNYYANKPLPKAA